MDQQAELAKRDFVVAIDKSGSMSTPDCVGGKSRWDYMKEQALNLARECAKFDSNGIDVIVFAGSHKTYNNVTPEKVDQIFHENSPSGSTDTAAVVREVGNNYFAAKKAGNAKPVTLLVFTDGEPNDEADLQKAICEISNQLDADEEFSISFLQVGKDAGAKAFLKKLDDDLQGHGAKFDIVDAKDDSEMENLSATEILVQSIND